MPPRAGNRNHNGGSGQKYAGTKTGTGLRVGEKDIERSKMLSAPEMEHKINDELVSIDSRLVRRCHC